MLKYFELDNDDMESSKRRSLFISLIFILKCFTKPFIVRNLINAMDIFAVFSDTTDYCHVRNLQRLQLFL